MNEIVNKFLLAGDKCMPEMHLSLDLRIVLVVLLLKVENKKIKETRDSRNIHKNELDKACFEHDMVFNMRF